MPGRSTRAFLCLHPCPLRRGAAGKQKTCPAAQVSHGRTWHERRPAASVTLSVIVSGERGDAGTGIGAMDCWRCDGVLRGVSRSLLACAQSHCLPHSTAVLQPAAAPAVGQEGLRASSGCPPRPVARRAAGSGYGVMLLSVSSKSPQRSVQPSPSLSTPEFTQKVKVWFARSLASAPELKISK